MYNTFESLGIIDNTTKELDKNLIALESLSDIRPIMSNIIKNGGLESDSAKVIDICLGALAKTTNAQYTSINKSISYEDFDNFSIRVRSTNLVMEGIGSFFKSIWEGIKNIFRKIWETIKKFFKWLFGGSSNSGSGSSSGSSSTRTSGMDGNKYKYKVNEKCYILLINGKIPNLEELSKKILEFINNTKDPKIINNNFRSNIDDLVKIITAQISNTKADSKTEKFTHLKDIDFVFSGHKLISTLSDQGIVVEMKKDEEPEGDIYGEYTYSAKTFDTIDKDMKEIDEVVNAFESIQDNIDKDFQYSFKEIDNLFKKLSDNSDISDTVRKYILDTIKSYQNYITSFSKYVQLYGITLVKIRRSISTLYLDMINAIIP